MINPFKPLQENDEARLQKSEKYSKFNTKNRNLSNLFSLFQQQTPGRSTGDVDPETGSLTSGDAWPTSIASNLGRESGLGGLLSPPPLSPPLKTSPSAASIFFLLSSSTTQSAASHSSSPPMSTSSCCQGSPSATRYWRAASLREVSRSLSAKPITSSTLSEIPTIPALIRMSILWSRESSGPCQREARSRPGLAVNSWSVSRSASARSVRAAASTELEASGYRAGPRAAACWSKADWSRATCGATWPSAEASSPLDSAAQSSECPVTQQLNFWGNLLRRRNMLGFHLQCWRATAILQRAFLQPAEGLARGRIRVRNQTSRCKEISDTFISNNCDLIKFSISENVMDISGALSCRALNPIMIRSLDSKYL